MSVDRDRGKKSRRVGRFWPMRCTCSRSVVAFTSASNTRRTKFLSCDHRCRRHLLYSPDTEYFDSARSNAMAPSSTTTAARAPLRKSESMWLSESGVMLSESFIPTERVSVIDGLENCLVSLRRGLTSVIWVRIPTASAHGIIQLVVRGAPETRQAASLRRIRCVDFGLSISHQAASRLQVKGIKIW